jgi:hypothetical protein
VKIYPYRRLTGSVELEVTAVRQEREGVYQHDLETWAFNAQERVVALHQVERADWESARFSFQARLPEAEIAAGPWKDVSVLAVLTEKATNARTTAELRPKAGGLWTGHLRMWKSMHLNRAELTVVVVATTDDVPGRMIGRADVPWIVDLTARMPVRQTEMQIEEVDFSEGPEWLKQFRDAPWIVETSGDLPVVHVNTAFEGVAEVLNSTSRDPMTKTMREMLATQIATEVWTSVFQAAVSGLDPEGHGEVEWPGGWKDAVLKSMLADVLPDLSGDDALREIHARRIESAGWSELQPRINYAAGRRAKIAKNLGTALRTLDAARRES